MRLLERHEFMAVALTLIMAIGSLRATESASVNTATSPSVGDRGMVSSAHPVATAAGLEILSLGGSAVDAAIAVASTLNVVEPQNSGMGGYGLILLYDADTKRIRTLNSSGRIPRGVKPEAFYESDPGHEANRRGPKAVSTPTNLNAWDAMWKESGRLEWAKLFGPAIRSADEGVPLNRSVAGAIHRDFDNFSDYSKGFYGKDGEPLKKGDLLVQKDLAESLRLVAEQGAKAIYGGPIGMAIDAQMRATGGFLALDDLLANEAEWWEPIQVDYRGYRVVIGS